MGAVGAESQNFCLPAALRGNGLGRRFYRTLTMRTTGSLSPSGSAMS